MIDTNSAQKYLTVQQVADTLQVSPAHIYFLIREGQMKCVRIGTSIRVTEGQFNDFVEENTHDEKNQ